MNREDILNIIGETKDKYVRDAGESRGRRASRSIVNIALTTAACLVVVPMLIIGTVTILFGGMGASAPAPEPGAAAVGDGAYREEYMSYEGPVLPLATLENSEGITAERLLDISFAPLLDDRLHTPAVAVTDSYLLTNSSSEDMSLTAIYPYPASWAEFADDGYAPELILDGDAAASHSVEIVFGPYTGSFVPVYGAEDDPDMDSSNLAGLDSFPGYEALLDGGSYLASAFGDSPELELPVTVYRLSDYEYTSDQSATNPTLNVSFEMDSERTAVLTWGFNGGLNNWEDGVFQRSIGGIKLRPNAAPGNQAPGDGYLIFVGEDIESYSIQGYKNGGCKAGDELLDLGCTVTRYETTLDEVLLRLLSDSFPEEAESLYRLTAENLLTVGPLSEDGVSRYGEGMLDSIVYDLRHHSRIAYLCFSLSISAGESMEIVLKTDKPASYNYYGAGGDTSLYGFEFATTLGSELEFITQEARLSDFEGIEIVSQNFGFDPEAGISRVELSTDTPNYYLNIRKKTSE